VNEREWSQRTDDITVDSDHEREARGQYCHPWPFVRDLHVTNATDGCLLLGNPAGASTDSRLVVHPFRTLSLGSKEKHK
jgi:hypothetical protein